MHFQYAHMQMGKSCPAATHAGRVPQKCTCQRHWQQATAVLTEKDHLSRITPPFPFHCLWDKNFGLCTSCVVSWYWFIGQETDRSWVHKEIIGSIISHNLQKHEDSNKEALANAFVVKYIIYNESISCTHVYNCTSLPYSKIHRCFSFHKHHISISSWNLSN